MRILDVSKAEVYEELGKTGAIILEVGSIFFDITVEKMRYFVGEGLYIQNTAGGVLFMKENQVGKVIATSDVNIRANTLGAHY